MKSKNGRSLSQRILAVLGQSPLPCSTPDLQAMLVTGKPNPRQLLWDSLRRLHRQGLIKRTMTWPRRDPGSWGGATRMVYWTLAT